MTHAIKFTKMQALGNDFMIALTSETFDKNTIKKMADRRRGIGFDQLLLLEPSKKADFRCRIFNSDGSAAEQCGNGLRCVARFLHEKKLTDKNEFLIETVAGIIPVSISDYQNITLNMGVPELEEKSLRLPNVSEDLTVLSLGNPHAIAFVDDLKKINIATLGAFISQHPHFPKGTNAGFAEIIDRKQVRLLTFERGAGETLACGSNASAAVAAGIWKNVLDKKVEVQLPLGSLFVEWESDKAPLFLTGSAEFVFEGEIKL